MYKIIKVDGLITNYICTEMMMCSILSDLADNNMKKIYEQIFKGT